MSNHSIIEHRSSYHFVKIEEDYLAICSNGECSPHCKALILAILEHWMNTKRDRGEGSYVYLTIPQWIKHTYMLYERNVITDCLYELMEEGLIERRPVKIYGQDTFEYTLKVDAIHKRIKKLPSKPDKETLPNLDSYLEYKARSKEAAKSRRAQKAEREEVVEKSRTPKKVREKSPRVREKSTEVGEKSPRVREKSIQHRFTEINSDSNIDSQRESAAGKRSTSTQRKGSSLSSSPSQKSFEEISPEAKSILDSWDEIQGYEGPRTEREIKTAQEMGRLKIAKEDMEAIKAFTLENNAEWYEKHGLDIHAILTYYPKWKSAQGLKASKASQDTPRPSVLVSDEITERNKARKRARLQAKELAQAGGS